MECCGQEFDNETMYWIHVNDKHRYKPGINVFLKGLDKLEEVVLLEKMFELPSKDMGS